MSKRGDQPKSGIPVALIYTRVSTEDQASEGLSLETLSLPTADVMPDSMAGSLAVSIRM